MTFRQVTIPKALGAILVGFFVLGLIYAWATPFLEASDELWHFGLVAHLATGGDLPVQDPDVTTPWEQEGSQPPLYYLLAAGIVRPFDLGDLDSLRQPNPHARAGIPLASDNKNLVLHATPLAPLAAGASGSAAAIYAVRLFGILLGLITIGAVYATARELAPARPGVALLAAGLTAFNPMFLFISASVNNDTLVIALGSLITWQLLVMLREGLNWRRSLLLAILLALAALTKLSGNVLIPVVALAGVCRRPAPPRLARAGPAGGLDGGRVAARRGLVVLAQPPALRGAVRHADDGRRRRAASGAVQPRHPAGGVPGLPHQLLGPLRRGERPDLWRVLRPDGRPDPRRRGRPRLRPVARGPGAASSAPGCWR